MVRALLLGAYAATPVLLAGRWLATRFLRTGSWLVAWTAGWAAAVLAAILLLACGWYAAWVWALLALLGNGVALIAFGTRPGTRLREAAAHARARLDGLRAEGGWAAAGLAALLGAGFLLVTLPPSARDEVAYHLVVPRAWDAAGTWLLVPDNYHWLFAGNLEAVWGWGLAAAGASAPRVLAFGFVLAALAALRAWTRALGVGAFAAWGSLAFFVATPLLLAVLPVCYVDWALVLFVLLGWQAARLHADTGEPRAAVTAGVALGLAAGTKHTAIAAALLLGLEWVAAAAGAGGARRAAAAGAALAAGLAAWCLPWLARNAWLTGDPVYPLGQAVGWGSGRLPPVDLEALTRYVGLGGAWRLDPLLYHATLDRTLDHRLHPGWPLLHLAVLALGWRRRRSLPWFTVAALTLLLFSQGPSPRVYVPLLALSWLFLPGFLDRVAAGGRGARVLAGAAIAACAVTSLPPVLYSWFLSGEGAAGEAVLGLLGDAGFLRKEGLLTPAVERFRREAAPGARVWVWCSDRVLHFARGARCSSPYDLPSFARAAEAGGSVALDREVATDGIDWVAVDTVRCPLPVRVVHADKRDWELTPAAADALEGWMQGRLEPAWRDERWAFLRVRAPTAPPASPSSVPRDRLQATPTAADPEGKGSP